ncbi:MAG: prepilin-type N-terminal cleavage/methylation domain-containing protein [Dehalococcoidales bacterium]|nr:prepilin-type N-terminal cleavage/methylation domain-containing protein [Dehalococcoidales bacterium]
MMKKFFAVLKKQKGFTLIELIVAGAIGVLVIGALVAVVWQLFNTSASSSGNMMAVRQVQNAGYWISQDALQAQEISTAYDADSGKVLELIWYEYEEIRNGDGNVISYAKGAGHKAVFLLNAGKLTREYYTSPVSDNNNFSLQKTSYIAEYLEYDPDSSIVYTTGKLVLTLTANTGGFRAQTAKRIYEVDTRPIGLYWD